MTNQFETNGMFSWFELMTDDVESSKVFYSQIIGWRFVADSNNPDYTLVMTDNVDRPIAGIIDKSVALVDNPKSIPNHWGSYITVKDIKLSISKVEDLGGKIIVPITKIEKIGLFCVIQDPCGAVVSLMEYHLEV